MKLCILLFTAVGRQSLASEVIVSPKQENLQNVRLAQLRRIKVNPRLFATWHKKKGKHWEDDMMIQVLWGLSWVTIQDVIKGIYSITI